MVKRLTCKRCGSIDFLKKRDIFICRACGCRYSLEEVEKMMFGVKGKIVGITKASGASLTENYLQMARKAFDAGDYREADRFCDKVITMDNRCWEAWFIKGGAVGRQSTFGQNRIPEVIDAFSKALRRCPEEALEHLKEECKEELKVLQSVQLSKRIRYFKRHPYEEKVCGLRGDVNLIAIKTANFFRKAGISVDAWENAEYARIISREAEDAWQVVYKNYTSRGYPTDVDLMRLCIGGEYLLEALKLALFLCGEKDEDEGINELKIQIYKNMICMQKRITGGRSYQMGFYMGYPHYIPGCSLIKEEKAARREMIDAWREKVFYFQTEGRRKAKEAGERRRREYWETHREEKVRLESELERLLSEKKSIESQIAELEKKKDAVPTKERRRAAERKIDLLIDEKQALGLFRADEKEVVQKQINEAKAEFDKAVKLINTQKNQIEQDILPLRDRCAEIMAKISQVDAKIQRSWSVPEDFREHIKEGTC